MDFGWDEGKRQLILADRKIDLRGMAQAFDGRPRLTYPSPRNGEVRNVSIAEINGKLHSIIWMLRGEVVWLITARRAWKSEMRDYVQSLQGRGVQNERPDELR